MTRVIQICTTFKYTQRTRIDPTGTIVYCIADATEYNVYQEKKTCKNSKVGKQLSNLL